MKLSHAVAASAFALLSSASHAGVLYTTGPATGASTLCISDTGCSGGPFTAYEQFRLSKDATITAIDWVARFSGGAADFRGAHAAIYASDPALGNAAPLHLIASQANPLVSNSALFSDAFTVTLANLAIELEAGNYWIGMQNMTGTNGATMACSDCTLGSYTQGRDGTDEYYQRRGDLAFRVIGTVPEPATVGLLALGLLGFAASRRSHR